MAADPSAQLLVTALTQIGFAIIFIWQWSLERKDRQDTQKRLELANQQHRDDLVMILTWRDGDQPPSRLIAHMAQKSAA